MIDDPDIKEGQWAITNIREERLNLGQATPGLQFQVTGFASGRDLF